MDQMVKDKICVALDVSDLSSAIVIIEQTCDFVGWYKIGLELISAQYAPQVEDWIHRYGAKVFYDAKLNDIPNTVGRAVKSLSSHVEMVNVHAMCGIDAMRAAVENAGDCKVLAVTVLTSLNGSDLTNLGLQVQSLDGLVSSLADAAYKAGVYGLVCSPKDLPNMTHKQLFKVTPGVRPSWSAADDQKRIMTPSDAIKLGSDLLVIGRPITNPPMAMIRSEAAKMVFDEVKSVSQSQSASVCSSA